jgi:hypothetical protein
MESFPVSSLPDDLRLCVRDALMEETTFPELVEYISGLSAEHAKKVLVSWVQVQRVGKLLAEFEGTAEELSVLAEHVECTYSVIKATE